MRLADGEFYGKPIQLLPWQEHDWLRPLLGTIDPATGLRQYREGFLFLPVKNGKTTLTAAICLYFLLDKNEMGGHIVSAAPTKKQAAYIYDIMVKMIKQDAYLSGICEFNKNLRRIVNTKTQTVYEAIANDAENAEGLNCSVVVVDEGHAFKNNDLFNVLKNRMRARRQPLLLQISTAGSSPNPEQFCYQTYEYAKKVRDGIIKDDAFLSLVFEAAPEDDPFLEETWKKANPSLGITAKLADIARAAEEAKHSAMALARFRRYTLNQWVAADDAWLNLDQWQANGAEFKLEELKGRDVYLGLDVSTNTDLTSINMLFPFGEGAEKTFKTYPLFFVPKQIMANKEDIDRVPYRTWAAAGLIEATNGDATDYEAIEAKIVEISKDYNIKLIGADRWNCAQMLQNLEKKGFNVGLVRQNGYALSAPLKEIERLLLNKRLQHPNHAVLTWNAANAKVEEGQMGDIRIVKDKSNQRIDGIVALANALFASLADNVDTNKTEELITDGRIFF